MYGKQTSKETVISRQYIIKEELRQRYANWIAAKRRLCLKGPFFI